MKSSGCDSTSAATGRYAELRGYFPVPINSPPCGVFEAPSATTSAPVLVPTAVGVKTTEIVQEAPPARLVPQVLVCEKSPVVVMLIPDNVAFCLLTSVTVLARLEVPTFRVGKVNDAGLRLTMLSFL